jgi:hypothetical protein
VIDEDVDTGYWRARAERAEALVLELRAEKARLNERVAELAGQVAGLPGDRPQELLQLRRRMGRAPGRRRLDHHRHRRPACIESLQLMAGYLHACAQAAIREPHEKAHACDE